MTGSFGYAHLVITQCKQDKLMELLSPQRVLKKRVSLFEKGGERGIYLSCK
jgi:hypothetical protein